MQRSLPLPDTHPELTLWSYSSAWREYRVENWHLSRDGSCRVVHGTHGWSWREVLLAVLVAILWPKTSGNYANILGLVLMLVLFAWYKCTQVLFESVIAFPPHGIQLETHRGLPSRPLTTSRRFIPLTMLEDFIINEGLRRWNVRFYLAAMLRDANDNLSLHVAYENILPHFPVLLEVYRGIHETMFDVPGVTDDENE